ncbi:MAG: DUF922 domain-containing protein, partial [Flavobacteriales bacterium]
MKTISFIFCLGISLLSFAPSNDGDELVWSPWQRLSWDDFNKRVGPKQLYKAFTYSGIKFSIEGADGKAKATCTPYFLKSESWVHSEHMKPELLVHEQGHFDITAVYGMKMQTEMNRFEVPISEFKEKNYMDKAQHVFDSIYVAMETRQGEYDNETNHGIAAENQAQWNRRLSFEIDSLLNLTAFAD